MSSGARDACTHLERMMLEHSNGVDAHPWMLRPVLLFLQLPHRLGALHLESRENADAIVPHIHPQPERSPWF
jgi:hypothetical protein